MSTCKGGGVKVAPQVDIPAAAKGPCQPASGMLLCAAVAMLPHVVNHGPPALVKGVFRTKICVQAVPESGTE